MISLLKKSKSLGCAVSCCFCGEIRITLRHGCLLLWFAFGNWMVTWKTGKSAFWEFWMGESWWLLWLSSISIFGWAMASIAMFNKQRGNHHFHLSFCQSVDHLGNHHLIPSGKQLQKTVENHHAINGKTHYFNSHVTWIPAVSHSFHGAKTRPLCPSCVCEVGSMGIPGEVWGCATRHQHHQQGPLAPEPQEQ